jgi:hypothetical protein
MRSPQEQAIHDKVLQDSAKSYLKVTSAQNIQTNESNAKNFEIEGKYPDVIIKLPTGEIILEEVETESTVNEKAMEKWRELSNLGHELRVLVPLSRLDLAKGLASRLTIPVNVQAYELSGNSVQWFGRNTQS